MLQQRRKEKNGDRDVNAMLEMLKASYDQQPAEDSVDSDADEDLGFTDKTNREDSDLSRLLEATLSSLATASPATRQAEVKSDGMTEPAPEPEPMQTAAEPVPEPTQPLPEPEPMQMAAEPSLEPAQPLPEPEPMQMAAEPLPEPEPMQMAAEPVPETAQPLPEPEPMQMAAEPLPEPEPMQMAAEPVPETAQPLPEPEPMQMAAEPVPETAQPLQESVPILESEQNTELQSGQTIVAAPVAQGELDTETIASATAEPSIESVGSSSIVSQAETALRPRAYHSDGAQGTPWMTDEGREQSVLSEIRSDAELDENDILMLIGMGYEEELRRTLGDVRVDSVKYHQDDTEPQDAGVGADHGQVQKEKEHFLRENKRLRIRFVVTAVLTAFFGVYDHLALFRSADALQTDSFLSTLAYPLIGMLLFWGCLAASWRFLYRSVQDLIHFVATPFSAVTLVVLANVLYDGILLFRWQGGMQMFHFAVCFLLLFGTVGEILYLRRTISSYEVAVSNADKYVLEPMQNEPLRFYEGTRVRRVQTARSENKDDRETRMYRVRKIDRLTGFFRRSEDLSSGCAWLIYLFSAIFLLAVAAGCAVGALKGSFNLALSTFMTVLLAGVPLSVPLYYALSGYYVATQLEKRGCAMIGDAAIAQYAGKKTLVFSDTEMFVARRRTRIKIRGEAEVKECTRLLQQLFHAIGGTLEGVAGNPDPDEEGADSIVQIADVSEDGIELYKDRAIHILMGDYAYLTKNDIPMPSVESSLGNLQRQEDSAVIYVAVDGRFKMGYAVDYEERKSFLRAADTLMQQGIGVAISTYDPNINEVFMARHAHGGDDRVIRIIKPERLRAHDSNASCTADSGILVTGREENMVEPVVACEKMHAVHTIGKRLQIFYSVLLALATVALVWTGTIGSVNGLEIAGVQILLCLPVLCVIRRRLCKPQTDKKGKKNKKEEKKQ